MDNAILDLDTVHKIFTSMNLSNSKKRVTSPEKKSFKSFKNMKKAAKKKNDEDSEMVQDIRETVE